ncbi:Transmembrane 9 superfamily member 7 [Diplonema papillatum]|nr:Transmembrane 9 superfamily member 7 [Diplonema papillatum]
MRAMHAALLLLAVICPAASQKHFHYIPGMVQVSRKVGQSINVDVNSMHSHEGVISYEFYSLPFCKPDKQTMSEAVHRETLGQVIWGDKIEPSMYWLEMKVPVACQVVCTKPLSSADRQKFETRINNRYRGNFVIDNLPVIGKADSVLRLGDTGAEDCLDMATRGWPLGVPKKCMTNQKTLIHNHVVFEVSVNKFGEDEWIIAAVNVRPYSIDHHDVTNCNKDFDIDHTHQMLTTDATTNKIIWSYGVEWKEVTNVTWANRWDAYLNLSDSNTSQVHWIGLYRALTVVLCLAVVVALILMRTLHVDFNRYNGADSPDEQQEEMGWKLVHADVFRPPSSPALFSVIIGTGVQLMGMMGLSVLLAILGYLSPANRGSLISAALFLFVFMSLANGMVTGYLLNMFQRRQWRTVFLSGFAYPGILFGVWLVMESVIFFLRSGANTAPLVELVKIMVLWIGISVPLVILGAAFSFRWPVVEPVTKVQKVPRNIPPQRDYLSTAHLAFLPGVLPFCAALVELRLIMYSMWQGRVYYMFGFLAISTFSVVIAAAEVTLVVVYFILVFEDHKWWWKSLIIPGGMGIHFFLYSIYYYKTSLHIRTNLGMCVYFTSMALVSFSMWLMLATIGFISSYIFIRVIYSRIKID